MNERIESIAVETLSFLRHNVLSRSDMEDIRIPDVFLEKFAELILQECLVLFENAKVNQEDDVDYGLEEAKDIIKEHFGVEE